jgi:hypothetical protein
MYNRATTLLVILALSGASQAADPGLTQDRSSLPRGAGIGEKNALIFLKAREESEKLVIHYRAGRIMDLVAMRHERDLSKAIRKLEKRFDMVFEGRIHVFLYRDRNELSKLSMAPRRTPQRWHGLCLHGIFDHDLAQPVAEIVLEQWIPSWRPTPAAGMRTTESVHSFLRAGLALAQTNEHIHQVSLRDWVAFYDRLYPMPSLGTIQDSHPRRLTSAPSNLIAGSWLRYLSANQGIDKVKSYCASQDCEQAFGLTLQELEQRWSTWLHGTKAKLVDTALMGFDDTASFERKIKGIKGRVRLRVAGDDQFFLFHNGEFKGSGRTWYHPTRLFLELTGEDRIEIVVINLESAGGLLMEIVDSEGKVRVSSDESWTARRAKTKPLPAMVMGAPISGPWKDFLSDARKPAVQSMRGSWIWIP